MLHLYFFVSSEQNDTIRQITISTINVKRAYIIACNYFHKHYAKGEPQLLAI